MTGRKIQQTKTPQCHTVLSATLD